LPFIFEYDTHNDIPSQFSLMQYVWFLILIFKDSIYRIEDKVNLIEIEF